MSVFGKLLRIVLQGCVRYWSAVLCPISRERGRDVLCGTTIDDTTSCCLKCTAPGGAFLPSNPARTHYGKQPSHERPSSPLVWVIFVGAKWLPCWCEGDVVMHVLLGRFLSGNCGKSQEKVKDDGSIRLRP